MLLFGGHGAQADVLALDGGQVVARRPGEGPLHRPEHEPAGPAHPVGDGPAGEVGDEQHEGERGEDDEEAAADGRAACD